MVGFPVVQPLQPQLQKGTLRVWGLGFALQSHVFICSRNHLVTALGSTSAAFYMNVFVPLWLAESKPMKFR